MIALHATERLLEAGEVDEQPGQREGEGGAEFHQPRIHGVQSALVAIARIELVQVAHVREHGADDRPQRGESQGDEHRWDEEQPWMRRGITEPLDEVTDQREAQGYDQGVALAEPSGGESHQRHEEQAAHLPHGAIPANKHRGRLFVAAEDIINGDVSG